ncbi:MAG: DNA2/NAM7 family helicase, partial [Cytophagales bacterium]|nr:DNA2/NAM7 family helicase [Cytophagales bacterium]
AISGISAKELYHRSNPQKASIPIPDFKKFPNHTWEEYKRVLRSFTRYELWAGKKDYIWRDRVSFSSFSHADKLEMIRLLSQIPEIGNELLSKHSSILKKGIHVEQLHALAPLKPRIQSLFDELSIPLWKSYYYISPNPKLSKKKIDKVFSDWKEFKTNGLRKPLPLSQVEDYIGKIQGYETAQRSFFQKIKWNLFSPDKKILQSLCQVESLDFGKNEISEVKKRLASSKEFYAHVDYIQSQSWGKYFPVGQNEMEISNWFQELKSAVELKEKINLFLDEHPIVEDLFKDQQRVDSHWMSLSEIYTSWDNYIKSWSNFFTIGQIVQMISEPGHSGLMKSVLEKDFDLLVEFDLLKDRMLPHELELAYRLMSENMEQPEALFENSIQLEWLNHMEELLPILRSASTYKIEDLTKELQDKIREKQQLSHEIVVQNVRERVYRNTTFNRLNNRVTYRELQHQVSKKKKIWPLRKVLNEFHEEVFNLMPCWLASPESVSAIFPMEPWFDLVIFDEASQCFAEKGLPAMFRAKQIVVTGDSQQLPPNDLYQVRWDNLDDDNFDASVDSLLDLCARYLPQVQLSEHYRSQNPSLIGFSNEHFYRNSLRMVPHAKANTLNRPAIQFVHVPGLWENNANKIEAEQVIRIALDIIRQNPQKELGIVTFNFRQQNLILDLLEQESILQNIPLPESLIVKNIENIQGDEKDIILFSIGYAPDSKGKLIMNFGSLNSEGGQNRLNVAITRAKERIIVVASLLPTQLLVDEAKHEGPRLLKKYLSYASQESTPNGGTYPPSVYSKTGLNFQLAHHFEQHQAKKPLPGFPFADLAKAIIAHTHTHIYITTIIIILKHEYKSIEKCVCV